MRKMVKSTVLVLFLITIATMAFASADEERSIEFLGFSLDGKLAMVKINDPNSGNSIEVLSIPKGKKKARAPFYSTAQAKKLVKKFTKRYKIKDKGNNSTQDPSGKITFLGLVKGKYFIILAMRGNRTAVFDKIPAGKASEIKIKEVWWSKNGRSMTIIINKKKSDPDYGFDIDTVRLYKYYSSALHFK